MSKKHRKRTNEDQNFFIGLFEHSKNVIVLYFWGLELPHNANYVVKKHLIYIKYFFKKEFCYVKQHEKKQRTKKGIHPQQI